MWRVTPTVSETLARSVNRMVGTLLFMFILKIDLNTNVAFMYLKKLLKTLNW